MPVDHPKKLSEQLSQGAKAPTEFSAEALAIAGGCPVLAALDADFSPRIEACRASQRLTDGDMKLIVR